MVNCYFSLPSLNFLLILVLLSSATWKETVDSLYMTSFNSHPSILFMVEPIALTQNLNTKAQQQLHDFLSCVGPKPNISSTKYPHLYLAQTQKSDDLLPLYNIEAMTNCPIK